jgi:kynurenine formamidase
MIDLTGPIYNGVWDYNCIDMGGAILPPIRVESIATIPDNGYDAHAYQLTSLSGTYLETAAHLIPGQPTIDQIPVEDFIRPARVMHLKTAGPKTLITAKDLEPFDPCLETGDALLIDTGWGENWDQPGYVTESPHFDMTALDWLLAQPFSILGLDVPCADENGEILTPLFDKGMLMVAPIINLRSIQTNRGTLMAFPLRIQGVCATPCRVVYLEGDLFHA